MLREILLGHWAYARNLGKSRNFPSQSQLLVSMISLGGGVLYRRMAIGSSARSEESRRRDLFERLAREHEGALMRLALRMCSGDRDRAADCVQESIVNAYKAFMAGKLDDVSGFRPWIFRILTNEIYADQRRRTRTTTSEDIEQLVESSQDKESPVEQAVLDGVIDTEIELALKSLSEEQRMAVLLVDVEELEYAEAAKALGVPIGTVRSRLARARLKMLDALTEWRKDHG